MLDMGAVERNVARQCYLANEPLPERIKNAPVLEQGLEFYLDAFLDLHSERQIGFGVGPIPWTSVRTYAIHYDLDEEQTEYLFDILKRVDSKYLERVNKTDE